MCVHRQACVHVCMPTHVCMCIFLLYCCCFGCFPMCSLYLDLTPLCKTHISKMLIQFSRKIIPSVQYRKPSLQMLALRALMPGGPIKAPTVRVSSALRLAWCIRGTVWSVGCRPATQSQLCLFPLWDGAFTSPSIRAG